MDSNSLLWPVEIAKDAIHELLHSRQLQWTIVSVAMNMVLTLAIWIGVYDMKTNTEISQMYFLGTSSNFTTGNELFDGMINGLGTICVIGCVSFVMLAFALFDFRRVVKIWLTISCCLILFGVSGTTAYDAFSRLIDISTTNGQTMVTILVALLTIVYGSFGLFAFFAESSLWLHQFYVITNCSLIAVFYLRVFPGNTTWFVLWSVVFWDAFAVLAPIGPLRKVQEKAADYSNNVLRLLMFTADEKREYAGVDHEDRDEGGIRTGVKKLIELYSKKEEQDSEFVQKIRRRRQAVNPDSDVATTPDAEGLAGNKAKNSEEEGSDDEQKISLFEELSGESEYSSTASEFVDDVSTCDEIEQCDYTNRTAADALNDGESVRLGFGDFVFYSLLVGQAATGGNMIATFSAALGVVVGLVITLTVLSSSDHTTPALPMSVILGTITYFHVFYICKTWNDIVGNREMGAY